MQRDVQQCLDRIAESLNVATAIWFKVNQKTQGDKIKNLLQLYVTKRNTEECSSGMSPEHTELDDLLQLIHERKKESKTAYYQKSSEKSKQINKGKEVLEDMQMKSLERLSETRKRDTQDNSGQCLKVQFT